MRACACSRACVHACTFLTPLWPKVFYDLRAPFVDALYAPTPSSCGISMVLPARPPTRSPRTHRSSDSLLKGRSGPTANRRPGGLCVGHSLAAAAAVCFAVCSARIWCCASLRTLHAVRYRLPRRVRGCGLWLQILDEEGDCSLCAKARGALLSPSCSHCSEVSMDV